MVREGEQHDMGQFTSDFLEYYKMYSPNAVNILGNEMLKRFNLYTTCFYYFLFIFSF